MVIELLRDLGIFAIGAGFVSWIAKHWIQQTFDKELKRYETELEKEKHQFSELHDKRAEVTAELYKRFIEFEEDMRSLTTPLEHSGSPDKDEKMTIAAESGNKFVSFYMRNKIYFPPEISDTIEDLQSEMKNTFDEFGIYRPFDPGPYDASEDVERWNDAWKRVTEDEVPELKRELEDHFRGLLGVESDH